MKGILLIGLSVLLCGFYIDTPETRREVAKADKRWRKEVTKRFDLEKLHSFLISTVDQNRTIEKVDLKKAAIGKAWEFSSMSMTSGDWIFRYNSKQEDFEFVFTYDDPKFVGLKCIRKSKSDFEFKEGYTDEWIEISY